VLLPLVLVAMINFALVIWTFVW